jgi:hypothetical protein
MRKLDLYLLEDGLLGNEPKPPSSSSLPKTPPDSLGSRVPKPISKKHSGPLLAQDLSETAQVPKDSKGKAPLSSPCKRPKLFVEAKAGSGSSPFSIRPSSLDVGASTSIVRAENISLGSGESTSTDKPGVLGQVYQHCNVAYPQSTAVWRVN